MPSDIEFLTKQITQFLERDFSNYEFNWIITEDFTSFDLFKGTPTAKDLASSGNKLHRSIDYVRHYYEKLNDYLKSDHLKNENLLTYRIIYDFSYALRHWQIQTFNKSKTPTRNIIKRSRSQALHYDLTASDLENLRKYTRDFITVTENPNSVFIEGLQQFYYLYSSLIEQDINKQIAKFTEKMVYFGTIITAQYHKSFALHADSPSQEWLNLPKDLQSFLDEVLLLKTTCKFNLSYSKSLRLPSFYAQKQKLIGEGFEALSQRVDKVLADCNSLKKFMEIDLSNRDPFENFSLASPFYKVRELQVDDKRNWNRLLIGSMSVLIFNNVCIFLLVPAVIAFLSDTASSNNLFTNLYFSKDSFLPRISLAVALSIPCIWIAWLSTKHSNRATYLDQEYNYRASLAATYTVWTQEFKTQHPEYEKLALENLFAPIRTSLDKKDPSSPLESLLHFFQGKTTRKLLGSIFKEGVGSIASSLSDLVKSLTGLIDSVQDKAPEPADLGKKDTVSSSQELPTHERSAATEEEKTSAKHSSPKPEKPHSTSGNKDSLKH